MFALSEKTDGHTVELVAQLYRIKNLNQHEKCCQSLTL